MLRDYQICIAPMIDVTDKHFRFFFRLLSRHVRLYTEMITPEAILYNKPERYLTHHPSENPVALQLGGSDPRKLADSAKIGEDFGYNEINLNVGCPSPRVQAGRFGACLLQEPQLVAECVAAMQASASIPVTVKTRIGVDDQAGYEPLHHFISQVAATGCRVFIIHARKAWLKGLSPKENRCIPPLNYDRVYQLTRDFPDCHFVLNGGLQEVAKDFAQHRPLAGLMYGRLARDDPFAFANVDQRFYGDTGEAVTRTAVVAEYLAYMRSEHARYGTRYAWMARHLVHLYRGQPGARAWRRSLTSGQLEAWLTSQQYVTLNYD